ncbi:hypothetical protein [uncultured Sphingomonas sp.]|uniref:hypothetical protein n=1 Tax=uncultured Sphingomonas sp. TaxID=158754 RepID=UPI0035CC572C
MSPLWLLLAAQAATPLGAPAVSDPVLAEQRGGFRLPSGIDVAITVQTQTVLDGAVVLRTVFRADQGAPTLTVLAPTPGQTVAATRNAAAAGGGQPTMPTVTYDRANGIQLIPGVAAPQIAVTSGDTQSLAAAAGLAPVAPGAVTDNGTVSAAGDNGLRTVTLQGPDLTITHLAGNAFGSAILNAGNDRAIDTQTSVSIDLHNAGPDVLGSSMFKIQDLAIASAALRAQ